MAETLVDNGTCAECGTEIRTAALFCYHCGAAVEQVEKAKEGRKPGKKKGKKKRSVKDLDSGGDFDLDNDPDKSFDKVETSPEKNGAGEINLSSAASIRNKARRIQRKRVEIYWEEHENAPNTGFLGVSVVLVLFTIVIFLIAMYLK